MTWLDIDHWSKPLHRPIMARLPDHRELVVEWNALSQGWQDMQGNLVARPVLWRELEPGEL